jgi:hypothetical protein
MRVIGVWIRCWRAVVASAVVTGGILTGGIVARFVTCGLAAPRRARRFVVVSVVVVVLVLVFIHATGLGLVAVFPGTVVPAAIVIGGVVTVVHVEVPAVGVVPLVGVGSIRLVRISLDQTAIQDRGNGAGYPVTQ